MIYPICPGRDGGKLGAVANGGKMNQRILLALFLGLLPGVVWAHASEQGFVLLLPTDVYIGAGVATCCPDGGVVGAVASWVAARLFVPLGGVPLRGVPLRHVTSLLSTLVLAFLLWRGVTGAHDPTANPLPLFVWTVFWIGMVSAQGLFGNHWRWSNPWTGIVTLLAWATGSRAPMRFPRALGHAPAVVIFLCFAGFLLADPAPADPDRLRWRWGAIGT